MSPSLSRRGFLESALGASLARPAMAAAERPNIVLILADDMGFSDIGPYGSEIHTPNLDRLAAGGVRFSQFYSCARCCPSRAALLTGLYPHQAGVGHMVDQAGPEPGYANDLSPRSRTIAEVLRGAGYQTGMSGKWHVTPITSKSRANWPLQRGFQRYYGIIHGASSYYNPVTLKYGNDEVAPPADYYITDAIGDYGVRFLDEFSKNEAPFFLYAAFTAPHWPLHARPEDIRKYEGRYRQGWDALRLERHERQLKSGMLPRRWDLTPRDSGVPAWSDVKDKEWQQRRMEVYAAQIDRLDQNIGRLLDKLKETGRDRNTLVLFMSDNGGCAEEITRTWRGWHVPKGTRSGGEIRIGNEPAVMPGAEDTYQSYGVPWANASNTPFRLYKHWVHEGGISSPLIVHWPDRIKPSSRWVSEPAHFIDVMATCCDAGGASYPKSDAVIPLEGQSLLPLVAGRKHQRSLFWEHEGNCAVREGPWKLARKFPGQWELYNMDADRTELHDLASRYPDRAARMTAAWDQWAARAGVLPWPEVQKRLRARV